MAWQHETEEDEGAGVDVSTLAAMSEYSSTAGGSQPSEPTVLLPEAAHHPMSHFDTPDLIRDEMYWYALEQATQDPHPRDSDLPPAEVAAMHMLGDDGEDLPSADDGGRGRTRDVSVQAIMRRNVCSVAPTAPLPKVRELFSQLALHNLPVTEGGRLVGVISSNDLLQLRIEPMRRARRNGRLQARPLMQAHPISVRESATVIEAATMICDGAFNALPVVDADDHLLGMVTSTDLIRVLAGH